MHDVKELIGIHLLQLDPNLHPGKPGYEAAQVLLLAIMVESLDVAPLAATLGLKLDVVQRFIDNGVAGGVIRDGKLVDAALFQGEDSGIHFAATSSVLEGYAERVVMDGGFGWRLTPPGLIHVEQMAREAGVKL